MKSIILILVLWMATPLAHSMSCRAGLTVDGLGTAWRTANWRQGVHPFRYFNERALARVIADPDLAPVAKRWLNMSEKGQPSDRQFLDVTYEYLVFLADIRLKFNIPMGGDSSKPKPLLDYLKILFDAKDKNLNVSTAIQKTEEFLEKFVHPEMGVDQRRQEALHAAINKYLLPQLHQLQIAIEFSSELTVDALGTAWRTASWRKGIYPFRYYNEKALARVVADPDLAPVAERWMSLNETSQISDRQFFDVTYQYLVFLADMRIKFDIPLEGNEGKPKPLLNYLETLFEARQKGLDVSGAIQTTAAFLKEFVHTDMGIDKNREASLRSALNRDIISQLHQLRMAIDVAL